MKLTNVNHAGLIYVWLAVWLNVTGWLLSAAHQLNAAGYAVSLAACGLTLAFSWRRLTADFPAAGALSKIWRRSRRPLPAVFLLATVLIFLGGFLYAPANFDALTYRLPRMLNWWQAGHWFWIPTYNDRMNYSGVGWEWFALPLLSLTRSDRALFLINALGFLLMPGLLFSIFRQLGVARRVAWTWMWLLPLAYGYATQAGSIGNDLTGTLFGLFAVHFGLRARRSGQVRDVWLALLAAALLTGVKLSNLPLALPCLVAVWPVLGLLKRSWLGSAAVALLALLVSAAPMMALNQHYTGSWNGDPHNRGNMQIDRPLAALAGNTFLLAQQSLTPPVLPGSSKLNAVAMRLLPAWVKEQYPRLAQNKVNELPGEEGAALCVGVTLPLLVVLVWSVARVRRLHFAARLPRWCPPVALAAWVGALVFLAKLGSEAGPRLLLPYYPWLLLPLLLLPIQAELLRRRWWRNVLLLLTLGIFPVLVLSISRPLWPAQTVTARLVQSRPDNPTLRRLADTYATYARRNDFLAPVRAALPDTARDVGFLAGSNDADYSLWRPLGQRRVKYPRAEAEQFMAAPNLEWVVIKEKAWAELTSQPLPEWAAAHGGQVIFHAPITELVSWGPEEWYLLHFPAPAAP